MYYIMSSNFTLTWLTLVVFQFKINIYIFVLQFLLKTNLGED